ncbi:MAG TPA: glycosyltransferase family 9 protein [Gemmatimonadaceae bacterium]|nr:glycosyltransferase family 9 protein [Gemmatimonadaceae bacterium]
MRLLGAAYSGACSGPPDWDARAYRVLYVRHDGIGDMIMATGTLRAIATAHPTIDLDVLTAPANAGVLEGNPHVRRVLTFTPGARLAYPASTLAAVRRARYDVVIDAMLPRWVDGRVQRPVVKSSTVMLMLASGAPFRVGMGGRPNDFIYNLPVAAPPERSAHHVYFSAALGTPFGVDPSTADLRPELHVSVAEREAAEAYWRSLVPAAPPAQPRVLVNVSAANARRRWPEERLASALRGVRSLCPEAALLVTGTPADRELVSRLAAHGGIGGVPSLRESFALAALADVVLTPDTSIAHASAALGTPVVVLLPGGHEHLVPLGGTGRFLFAPGESIASIQASEVVLAVCDVLRAGAVSAARPPRPGCHPR